LIGLGFVLFSRELDAGLYRANGHRRDVKCIVRHLLNPLQHGLMRLGLA
jgi:hypothetical protein